MPVRYRGRYRANGGMRRYSSGFNAKMHRRFCRLGSKESPRNENGRGGDHQLPEAHRGRRTGDRPHGGGPWRLQPPCRASAAEIGKCHALPPRAPRKRIRPQVQERMSWSRMVRRHSRPIGAGRPLRPSAARATWRHCPAPRPDCLAPGAGCQCGPGGPWMRGRWWEGMLGRGPGAAAHARARPSGMRRGRRVRRPAAAGKALPARRERAR